MRILHLSDTHLFGDGSRHHGIVDTAAALDRVLAAAAEIEGIDAVVASGDLSDDGSAASYRHLRAAVGGWASRRDAVWVPVMGNHDSAAGFEQVLGARVGTVRAGGVRFVRLDSAVAGAGYGRIGDDQLAWLEERLAQRERTVVVIHHPPIPATSPLLRALELQGPQQLLDLCARYQVIAILSGHYHHPLVSRAAGVPVIVAPGIANTSEAYPPVGRERARIGSGFAVVDIVDDDTVRVSFHTAPSADDGRLLFDLGPDEVARIAGAAGRPADR